MWIRKGCDVPHSLEQVDVLISRSAATGAGIQERVGVGFCSCYPFRTWSRPRWKSSIMMNIVKTYKKVSPWSTNFANVPTFLNSHVPKDSGGECKKDQESDVEAGAFCPVTDDLWQNAFEEEPCNDQCKWIDCNHPDGKCSFL